MKKENYSKYPERDLKRKLEELKIPLLQSSEMMTGQKIPIEKHKSLKKERARILTELNRRKNEK